MFYKFFQIILSLIYCLNETRANEIIRIARPTVYLESSKLCPDPTNVQPYLQLSEISNTPAESFDSLESIRYKPCLFRINNNMNSRLLLKAEIFAINSGNYTWTNLHMPSTRCKHAFQWIKGTLDKTENQDDDQGKKFLCQSRPMQNRRPQSKGERNENFLDIWTDTDGIYFSPSNPAQNWLNGRYIFIVFMVYFGSTCSHIRVQQYINTAYTNPNTTTYQYNCQNIHFDDFCADYECSQKEYILRNLGVMMPRVIDPYYQSNKKNNFGLLENIHRIERTDRKMHLIRNFALLTAVSFIIFVALYKLFLNPYKNGIRRELSAENENAIPESQLIPLIRNIPSSASSSNNENGGNPSNTNTILLNEPRGSKNLWSGGRNGKNLRILSSPPSYHNSIDNLPTYDEAIKNMV